MVSMIAPPACRKLSDGRGNRFGGRLHRRRTAGSPEQPIYEINHATERVAAAVEAARALPFPFTLVARAENYVRGNPNLDDTIKRLVAYEKAGADVLFAPGLPDLAAVRAVCSAVSKPVNFAVGAKGHIVQRRRTRESGRETHQFCRIILSRGNDGPGGCGARSAAKRNIQLFEPRDDHGGNKPVLPGVKWAHVRAPY